MVFLLIIRLPINTFNNYILNKLKKNTSYLGPALITGHNFKLKLILFLNNIFFILRKKIFLSSQKMINLRVRRENQIFILKNEFSLNEGVWDFKKIFDHFST